MSRRKSREIALKVLYQVDLVGSNPEEAQGQLVDEARLTEKDARFTGELVAGTMAHQPEIDASITRYSPTWPLARMGTIERNLLRLAAFEILYGEDAHPVVVIDEAVELAKKYGDDHSKSFVNAILDKIREESEGQEGSD
ncbi:MAG: transcription antitermination factor NusB [Solirubrobacterales bacterium]